MLLQGTPAEHRHGHADGRGWHRGAGRGLRRLDSRPGLALERGLAGLAGGLLCYAAGWADLAGLALLGVVLFLHFGRRPLKVGD